MSVAHSLRGTDKTGGFASTKPPSHRPIWGFGSDVSPPSGWSGRREPTSDTDVHCPVRHSTDSGRDGTTGVVASAGDRLSQAVRGGSGSALVSATVPATTVVEAGAQHRLAREAHRKPAQSGLVTRHTASGRRPAIPAQPRPPRVNRHGHSPADSSFATCFACSSLSAGFRFGERLLN